MQNFITAWKNQIAIPTTNRGASTTDVNGPLVDLFGFNCAVLMVEVGTIVDTGTVEIEVEESDDGTTWTDMEGTAVSLRHGGSPDIDQSNEVVMIELTHPLKRYVRATVDKGTANSTIRTGRWFLGHAAAEPVSQPGDVTTLLKH